MCISPHKDSFPLLTYLALKQIWGAIFPLEMVLIIVHPLYGKSAQVGNLIDKFLSES